MTWSFTTTARPRPAPVAWPATSPSRTSWPTTSCSSPTCGRSRASTGGAGTRRRSPPPGADDFTIRIFADNGSAKPVATPLYERHVGAPATRTRLEPNLFQYSVGVPPVALNGATRYWLSIVNHTTWAPDVYWCWSSVDSVPFAPYGRAVDAGDWFQFQSGGGAFQLFVPEPSSPALVCAGTVVMLARRRRSCLRDDVTAIAAPA